MSTLNTREDPYTGQESYENLRQENQRLHEDNERLSARVVALAQGEYQITDDKITKKFREIRDGIDIWVDELQDGERRDFKAAYNHALKRPDREKVFYDLGFRAGCLDEKWGEELGRLETCIYVILGMVISNRLRGDVFNEAYPLGIKDYQTKFLDLVEKSMVVSSQTKDLAKFYRWRGETISAISNTSEFNKFAKYDRDILLDDVQKDMSRWLGPKLPTKLVALLREKIVQPAVDFQRMIHCSGKKFDVEYINVMDRPVLEIISKADVIDISEWRVSRNDVKGVFKCWLPALVMTLAIDQRDITFVNPVLLGYKASSLEPKRSARSSPVRQSSARERVAPDTKQLQRRDSPQSHTQQSSRSPTSKSHKSEPPSTSKPGGILMKKLFTSRSGSHSESNSSRKGSTSSTRNTRQELPPQSNTIPLEHTHRTETTVYTMTSSGATVKAFEVSPTRRTFTDRPLQEEPLSNLDPSFEMHDGMAAENRALTPGFAYANIEQWEYPNDYSHQ